MGNKRKEFKYKKKVVKIKDGHRTQALLINEVIVVRAGWSVSDHKVVYTVVNTPVFTAVNYGKFIILERVKRK